VYEKFLKSSYGFILFQAVLLPFNRSVKRLAEVKINVHGQGGNRLIY
jgi:hypothetical protein